MTPSHRSPVFRDDAFGTLAAFPLTMMLHYVEHPIRCGDKVEYGIPFFDDLDAAAKTVTLHQLAVCLCDLETEMFPENVYTASALAALENFTKETVAHEVEMREWSRKKYGEENQQVRKSIVAAYRSRYPHDAVPEMETNNPLSFVNAVDRLFSEMRPKPYYWLADTPPSKRKELMERLAVPADYFEPFFGKDKMTEKEREEHCRLLLAEAISMCESLLKRNIQTEIAARECWWMEKSR